MVPIGGGLARGDGPLAKDSLPPVSLLVVFVLLLLFFPLFFFFFSFFPFLLTLNTSINQQLHSVTTIVMLGE